MKIALLSISVVLLMASCNNNKKEGEITVTSEDGKSTATLDAKAMSGDDLQKKMEQLQNLTPYTVEQLKAIIPETLAGAPRVDYSAQTAMGTAMATGEYKLNDSTEVELSIFDCAGQAGAGVYNIQFLTAMNLQSESEDEYTRTIDFNGGKAIEHAEKSGNNATLSWFAADRFLVSLQGDNMSIDELKKAAGELKFK